MPNTDLQNQLGLGLVAKQTAKMNNTPKYSFQSKDALTGGVQIFAGIAEPQQIDLGGGPAYYNNSSSRDGSLPIQDSFNQSYSAPASVSTPESTTNMAIDDTFSGITRKKNTNIAETIKQVAPVGMQIESPVIPENKLQSFKDATKGQDVQFRQSYRQAMTPKPPLDESGLSGAELQAYKMLTPQEQAQYKALATQGMKAQTDYLTKSKANMEFQKSQEEQRLAMEENADAISDMMSKKNIEESQKQVANLKQNIGYLGSGGQPGISSQKLDAISNQVTLADRTLKNIIEAERLQKANREIGQEKNAEIFTRQIKILQDDLDSKVNKTIQGALNTFNSAELEGKLDTIPEIEAFQQQLYAQLDGDLSSIMDTNIQARQFLIERYDKLAESQKAQMQAQEKAKADYQKNANTLNKEMSQALGYYVNANGEALVDRKTGQNIVVPPETTTNYDASTGQMILMTKNRDGSIGVQIKQVGSGQIKAPQVTTIENPDGTKTTMQWTGSQWTPIQSPVGTVNPTELTPSTIASISPRLQRNNVQCGEVSNDYAKVKFPNAPRMGDSYDSKLNTINSIGVSQVPQVGGLFVMNTGTSTGHTGIVQSVNIQNGTFTATDANKEGNKDGGPVTTSTYNIGPKTTFSVAPSSQPHTEGLADDINVKVANIGNIAFGRTMSDAEGKRVESIIKKNPNASVNDIALAVRGLNIDNEEDKPTALEYIGVFDKISENVKPKGFEMTISKYINSGDYKGLNNFVSKYVENDAKATTPADQFISTPENNKVTKNIDEVIKLINENKDKIGAVDGRYTQLVKKFQSEPDIQKLQTLMTGTFADLRKNFAGSAVTATELTALEDFIAGSTTEVPENLITKLKTLKDVQTGLYKDQRSMYQLPNVKALEAKKWFEGFSLSDIISKLN